MKKTLATLMGLALVLPITTTAMARDQHADNHGKNNHGQNVRASAKHKTTTYRNHGAQVRQVARANPFRKGQRFVSSRAPHYQVVDYHQHRRLSAPPRGYHWVRSGNDALLVAVTSGIITSIVAGQF